MKQLKIPFTLIILFISCNTLQAQRRIISLAPSLTQNLFLLGAEKQVVGYTSYCEQAVHGQKEIVASAVKVNLEKVLTLQPDLIISTTITNPESVKQLRNFGIQVEIYPTPVSFAEICEQFIQIGEQIGKTDEALEIVQNSQQKVDSLTQNMKRLPEYKMFFQVGANPLYCVPPKTFMHDYMRFANGQNIAEVPGNGSINRETVAVRNPDVIFLTAMGIIGDDEKEIWMRYPEIQAVKDNKIFILDSNKSCSPTPVTFVETLDTIAQLLR